MLPLLLALSALAHPLDALAPYHTHTALVSATPEMHWFEATFIEAEWAGCHVGIPVDPDQEPTIGCYYPASPIKKPEPPPPELKGAWKQARKMVKASNSGLSNLEIVYSGTSREVVVEDVVPLEEQASNGEPMFWTGDVVYQLAHGVLTPRRRSGGTGLACYADDCSGRVWLQDATPIALQGTSVLFALASGLTEPAYVATEQAMHPAILAALARLDAGETTPPPDARPEHTLPQHGGFAVEVEIFAISRPTIGESGGFVCDPVSFTPDLGAPLSVAASAPLEWEAYDPSLDLHLRVVLDLPGGRYRVEAQGPGGEAAREVEISAETLQDGETTWLLGIQQGEELDRVSMKPPPPGHENGISLPGTGCVRQIDVYQRGIERSPVVYGE